ncbi:MAG: tail fiber domain-containing protein [Firmicutes bacterium]|nr:tail fiber domain-containing protein [Bacillota bacterium]
MILVITDAGKQALVNATQTGTAQLQLSEIAVGSGQYTPSAEQTALQNQIKRLPIIQASAVDDHVIHVAYQDDSSDSYNVYEVGVFTSDGVLFAVYSSSELIIAKAANSTCLLTVDMAIDDLDVEDITFGDIEYATGAATTESAGIVELATQAETDTGTDAYKVITPLTLATYFSNAFDNAFESDFPGAFSSAFESAFAAAFADTFPTAFDNAFEHDFGNAFNTAFENTFSSSFDSAFDDAFNDAFSDSFQTAFNSSFQTSFDSSFGTAFQARLASKSATLTGTSGSYAVTPAGLNYAITNMTWNIGKATATATGATAARSLSAHFADNINPLDFGAKGDGTTNDTNAFTAFENVVSGQPVDLLGKTYKVNARPTLNDYYNGKFSVSGASLSPVGVNVQNGIIVNAEGASNPDFFPSGKSRIYQADSSTNQVTLARFTNDDSGNSLVFFKSRGASVNTSKSAIAGDTIAWLNFMVDNGNIDYSGTLQGAMAARIEACVFESSSLTSAGTVSNGVRGALRLTCNNDNSGRTGTGIEVLSAALRPTDDNLSNLGTSGRRWKTIYAMTDVISTSDERDKDEIRAIPEKVLDAWEKVEFKQYKFKGENEIYFGVIAQEIISAFESEGLDAREFGLLVDNDGHYGVMYRECHVLEAACLRRRIARIESMLEGRE